MATSSKRATPTSSFLLLRAVLLIGAVNGCDTVAITNSDGQSGLLVDGQGTPDPINDFRLSSTGQGDLTFKVGNFDAAAAPHRNEVLAFGSARAPTRKATRWTGAADAFMLTMFDEIEIPLTFWIVVGNVGAQEFRIEQALIRLAAIWETERAGLRVGSIEVIDASNDADIDEAVLDSDGGDGRDWDQYSDQIGFAEDRINIYWINGVDGSTMRGASDFNLSQPRGRIVMGQLSGDHLLAHEIGHSLALVHVGGANFNSANVMAAESLSRSYLTEGQIFRAHFEPLSAVNHIYHARPGQPTVACPQGETEECPDRARRIWADATLPPN